MIRKRIGFLLHNYWWWFLMATLLLTGQQAITVLVYDAHLVGVDAYPLETIFLTLDTLLIVLFPLMVTLHAMTRVPTPLWGGRARDGCLIGLVVNTIVAIVSLLLAMAEGLLRFSVLRFTEPRLSVYVLLSLGGIVLILVSGAAVGWVGFLVAKGIGFNR